MALTEEVESLLEGSGFNYVYSYSRADLDYSDKDDENIEEKTDFYGEDGFYKRFNMAAEIGVGFRIGALQLNAQYSKGINDHEVIDIDGVKTRQNKFSIGLSYLISAE